MTRPMIAVSVAVALVLGAGLIFLRPRGPHHPAAASSVPLSALPTSTTASTTTSTPAPTTTTSTTAPTTTTSLDVGTLPQTREKPSGTDPALAARMQLLVQAIASGDVSIALPAFFPLQAYVQVKAVANPTADWRNRLVSLYDQDIAALHRGLGGAASSISFVGVDVPDSSAQWLGPGAEYNRIGYWRVFNSVVHYTDGSKMGSFVVISLISWRGQWYVVHFRTPPK